MQGFVDTTMLEIQMATSLSEQQKLQAEQTIKFLSARACHYAGLDWSSATVPMWVCALILNAAERYMRNPDAFTLSDAGDERVGLGGVGKASADFTDVEREELRQAFDSSRSLSSYSAVVYSAHSVYREYAPLIWVNPNTSPIRGSM